VSNSGVFCNTPWYELHIYWDGSLGICCQEAHKLYSGADYNIATMTIQEWFNSEPVRDFRQRMLKNTRLSECSRCYKQEDLGGNSRRHRANQKSVIFNQAFGPSFEQSPGRRHFDESGFTTTQPIDIHIDLGNYCNLACKMCNAQASSKIAAQEVKWGIHSSQKFLGFDWTQNAATWNKFKQQLLGIPGLNNIHFMGGETLLTDRFEDLVDTLIEHKRFETRFSFVTNGTIFKPKLLTKLAKFRRVGIEVSIETVDEHNTYQRQGTDTQLVLANIDRYLEICNNTSITVSLRPAISALTVGYFGGLLKYALARKLTIKSLQVDRPEFLDAAILPNNVKQQYIVQYQDLLKTLEHTQPTSDYNASDLNNYQLVIKQQAQMCINMLSQPESQDVDQLLGQLVEHCKKWDKIYGLDARELYPELTAVWDQYGY
jgi:sulfatase maturation enzyme AslB (radical SAM superfamily)